MRLIKRKIFFLVWSLFGFTVFSCDIPEYERFECGYNIKTKEQCWEKNCCYDKLISPKCHFRRKDAAGSPIKHSNGLCVFPKFNSTNNTLLIWSSNCSSKDAMFLVSHNQPINHLASGKCIFPKNGKPSDPGKSGQLILGKKRCETVTFRTADNGNLEYYYLDNFLKVCIGEGFSSFEPKEGDPVAISERACVAYPACTHITYVYEQRFQEGANGTIACPESALLQVTWAHYGPVDPNHPALFYFAPEAARCTTNTTTSRIRSKCNGQLRCHFQVNDYGVSDRKICPIDDSSQKYLVVRYSCIWNPKTVLITRFDNDISHKSVKIRLAKPRLDDKFVQIIVMKLPGNELPKQQPDSYSQSELKSYNEKPTEYSPYIAAELCKNDVNVSLQFTVGDGQRYNGSSKRKGRDNGFLNARLKPGSYYSVFQRTYQDNNLYYNSQWMDVVHTTIDSPKQTNNSRKNTANCTQSIVYIVIIGVQFVIIIILGVLVVYLCRKKRSKTFKAEGINERQPKYPDRNPRIVLRSTSHEYEIPNREGTGYEDLRIPGSPENKNVYQSLHP